MKARHRMAEKIRTAIWRETPKRGNPFSAKDVHCRGYSLYQDLLGKKSWEEMTYLMLRGELPSPREKRLFNLVLVALANPGPRDWATRAAMGAAVGKASIGNCLVAGLSVHQGRVQGAQAVEESMKYLQALHAGQEVQTHEGRNGQLPKGFGLWYGESDLRAKQLFRIAKRIGPLGPHARLVEKIGRETLKQKKGSIQLTAATGALLLDLGFNPKEGAGIFLAASTSGILAHSLEQLPRRWNEYPAYWREDRYHYTPLRNEQPAPLSIPRSKVRAMKKFRGHVYTSTGDTFKGRRDFWYMGYRQFGDLTGRVSFMQHFMLSVSGKLVSKKKAAFLDLMAVMTNYGDPRLWMHQSAAAAANLGCSTAQSLVAALASIEGERLGPLAGEAAAQLYQEVLRRRKRESFEKILEEKLQQGDTLYGYGRPLVQTDERVPVVMRWARRYGYDKGPYTRLAFEIEQWVKPKKNIVLNAGGLVSALMLDLGFQPRHVHAYWTAGFSGAMQSMIWEQTQREPGTFLPMACDDIEYVGLPPRKGKRNP